MSQAPSIETEQRLILRARAAGAIAALVAGEQGAEEPLGELADALARLGLGGPSVEDALELAEAARRGTVPPYETSYEEARRSPGGMTFQMADVSGFYRAFGFEAAGERPDHLAPELEFTALLLVKEAHALLSGNASGAKVCRAARGKFLAEHLGVWLPAAAARAGEEGFPGAARTLRLVTSIAAD